MKEKMKQIIEQTIEVFCQEFMDNPYMSYTEHGFHAYFYTLLYNSISEDERYIIYKNNKMCIIQKEYPTINNLGKSRRQNWDIAIIDDNFIDAQGYDFLPLHSVIEFGLNESAEHFEDDLKRLSAIDNNVKNRYIVHLIRVSDGFSRRDVSEKNLKSYDKIISKLKKIIITGKDVQAFCAVGFEDKNKKGLIEKI